jgi:muramoyltetrapeptide carboxypeptidase LdcA involved in peptidoglycan recycling
MTILKKMLKDFNIPIWNGLPIGHGSRNIPLPVGAPASIDAEQTVLSVHL